jgi:hypothetical protein
LLFVAISLPSCSFLLDFDSLQGGSGTAGQSNGGANPNSGGSSEGGTAQAGTKASGGASSSGAPNAGTSGGGASNAGASSAGTSSAGAPLGGGGAGGNIAEGGAGGVACECSDTDTDPCTVARCVDRGNGPECVQDPIQGMVLERDFDPIVGERHHQLGLVAGPSEFYLSSLSTTGNASNAVIYRLTATSTTVTPALELAALKIAGQPVSLPAIAVDTTNGLRLHAFVALRELGAAGGAKAWRVTLDADLKPQGRAAVGTTYALAPTVATQTQQPAALSTDSESWGAWVNADGTIGVASANVNPETLTFGDVTTPASSVALLTTRDNRPAVLFTADGAGVYLQSEMGLTQLSECQPSAGQYFGAYTAPTTFSGLWALGWTKSGTDFLTSEGTLGLCPANGACAADAACDANEDNNLTRNPGVGAQHIQGDPAGVMYYVDVLPTLVPVSATTLQASLSALLVKIDFGTSPNLSDVQPPVAIGEPLLLTTQTTNAAANYRGPDHAAAAIIADTAAVAWIEPTADGNDQIRVQRYKMCLPQ